MLTKICTKCNVERGLDDFSKSNSGKYGKTSVCKFCKRTIDAQYRKTHKEEIKEKFKIYYQNNRERRIHSSVMWKKDNPERGKANADRWREKNREADRKSKLEYYYRNPNYINEWRARNPHKTKEYWERRRARKLNVDFGDVTAESFTELCSLYGNKCLRCGKKIKLTIDHILPLSMGGTHSMDNIQPLCKPCNNKKYTSMIDYRPTVWEQL